MDLLGVLVGRAEDEDDAKKICDLFDDCPYSMMNMVKEKILVLLFSIPENHKWWLEGVKKEPEKTLRLSDVEVFFSKHFIVPPKEVVRRDESPCGINCKKCKYYLEECKGCPSVFSIKE